MQEDSFFKIVESFGLDLRDENSYGIQNIGMFSLLIFRLFDCILNSNLIYIGLENFEMFFASILSAPESFSSRPTRDYYHHKNKKCHSSRYSGIGNPVFLHPLNAVAP